MQTSARCLTVFLFISLFCSVNSVAALVTFQVDMSQMVVSAQGVHLAGNFQGWDPATTPMVDLGGGIYSITLDLPPGDYQFKFINGDSWGMDETVPVSCGIDGGLGIYNRFVTVTTDAVLPAVCYSQCNLCTPASFVMNGSAIALGGDCYQITPNASWVYGAFWSNTQIDLQHDFDLQFVLSLGSNDVDGADGVVFVLQRLGSAALGANGGGMGYSTFGTSLGVEFDTFYNPEYADPAFDHIAIEINGEVNHSLPQTIGNPVQMSAINPNTEDGLPHIVGIHWEEDSHTIQVYFDCELRLSATYDLVNDVFGGESLVFWGFTGATGVYFNQQLVCAVPTSMFTDEVDICPGSSTVLNAGASILGDYEWSPITYLSDAFIADPVASPISTMTYQVTYTDWCFVTVVKEVTVNVLENGAGCFALPIELGNFEAHGRLSEVEFSWTTQSEVENDFFTIEESADGILYNDFIYKKGAGNSPDKRTYEARGARSKKDRYYRLKQTDINGESRVMSHVEFVRGLGETNYRLAYNEVTNKYALLGDFSSEILLLEMINATGQRISFEALNTDENAITIPTWGMSGIYFIRLRDKNNNSIFTSKLLVH